VTTKGLCCSGGGIRAAGFTLGAIDELERRRVLDDVDVIAAVSGGAYTATAWALRRQERGGPAAASLVDELRAERHQFLRNGPGGLGGAIVGAIGVIAANLTLLATAIALPAWVVGRLVGFWSWRPGAVTLTVAAALLGLGALWTVRAAASGNARVAYGGNLLVVAVGLAWAARVASDAAFGVEPIGSSTTFVIVATFFVVVNLTVDLDTVSLHPIYRRRLRATFAPGRASTVTWDDLRGPELVLCCARHAGRGRIETFTISQREVRMGARTVPTAEYLRRLVGPRRTHRRVASWLPTTGAALASSMRFGRGRALALVAALNLDLGVWLPNPGRVRRPRRVGILHLLAELTGVRADRNRNVFVTDGGHRENLGLVELLRRGCTEIICLDASGGELETIESALRLARTELGVIVDPTGLDRLRPIADGELPSDVVAVLPFAGGRIVYARARLASCLDATLLDRARTDRRYPRYPTSDQFLTDDEFGAMIALGRAVGSQAALA